MPVTSWVAWIAAADVGMQFTLAATETSDLAPVNLQKQITKANKTIDAMDAQK